MNHTYDPIINQLTNLIIQEQNGTLPLLTIQQAASIAYHFSPPCNTKYKHNPLCHPT